MFKSLIVEDLLREVSSMLKDTSSTSFLDSRILLSHILQTSQSNLLALDKNASLSKEQAISLENLVSKRLQNYPIAYLINMQEFYGRPFYVAEGVLVPRADSEIIIDTVKELNQTHHFKTIRDVGTGSGCLAITLALELPNAKVFANDISTIALDVFEINNKKLANGKVELIKRQNLDDKTPSDIMVANLPYLTTDEVIDCMTNQNWHEPRLALDGGYGGLDIINIVIRQAKTLCKMILLEADPRQMDSLEEFLVKHNYSGIERRCDLRGDERIIFAINNNTSNNI